MAERAELAIVLSEQPGMGTGAVSGAAGPAAVADEVARLRQFLDQYLGPVGGILKQAGSLIGPSQVPTVPAVSTTAAQAAGLPEVLPAGGGLAGLAGSALGPLAIAEATERIKAAAINAAAGGIREMGEAASKLAGNDGLGMLMGATERTAQTLEQIPIVGQTFAAELRFVTAHVTAFRDAVNAFVERGRQLAPLSGELTQAGVTADVRSLLADIREANELGPDLARLTDAQSRAWNEAREIILPIKKMIVENLAEWMERIAKTLEDNRAGALAGLETTKIIADILSKLASNDLVGGILAMKDLPEKVRKAIEDALKKPEDVQDAIDRQLADLAAQQGQALGGPPDPVRQAAQQGLQIPLF